jgi:hypothetical protein
MEKEALHQHERGKERLNLSPESVNSLQRAIDRMWFGGGHKKLTDNYYHVHINDPNNQLLGYGALKRVNASGKRPRLILASILNKHMQPRGTNISHFIDHKLHDNKVKLNTTDKFDGFDPAPNNKN